MHAKICECCGKRFLSKSKMKKYCSNECKREIREQLCWRCKNACGGCKWSKELKPIDGWVAEFTIVGDSMGSFSSYKIKKCPEFIRD